MNPDVLMFSQVMAVIVTTLASISVIGLGTRYLWRLGSKKPARAELAYDDERTQRLENAVDAIAIEVERISEAQRFMIGLLGDSLPARRGAGELGGASQGRVITPH